MTPAIAFNDTFPFQFLKLFLLFVARKKPKTKTKTDQPFPNQFPINNSHFSTNFGNFPPISRQRRWIRRAWLRHWVPLRTLAEYTKIHLIFFFSFKQRGTSIDRSDERMTQTCSSLFRRFSIIILCVCVSVSERKRKKEKERVFLSLSSSFFSSLLSFSFRLQQPRSRSPAGAQGATGAPRATGTFASERYRDLRLRLTAAPTPEPIILIHYRYYSDVIFLS